MNKYVANNSLIINIFQIILLFYGGSNVLQGNITVGDLTILNSYYAINQNSIKYLVGYGKKRQAYKAAHYRLEELLSVEEEQDGTEIIENITHLKANISSLLHEKNINLQFELKKGEMLKLEGSNGAGKTTLTKILIGLYKIDDNNMIWINGVESKFLNLRDSRRRHVAYVPQQLFKKNITVEQYFCDLGIDLKKTKFEMLEDDYHFLKKVYYQRLSSLSGGQLQKVNILSRIFPTKSILIFDEPTSFLDSSSKEWFYLLLKRMKSNSIIILISHDDYFNDLVDYAIDMDVDSRDIYGRKE